MITPDTLTITINTQIPGNQVIKYTPSMTVPKSEDKYVLFNPLVKLSESIVRKLPKDIQIKEFFNKGYFVSLLRAQGPQEKISLGQAKFDKIIDNNISVTLNTLFPEDGLFYIKDEPYTIAGMEWKQGNWKIDKKINNLSNVVITKDSIEKEMNSIPEDWLYGDGYVKKEVAPSNEQEKPVTEKPEEVVQPTKKPEVVVPPTKKPEEEVVVPTTKPEEEVVPATKPEEVVVVPPTKKPEEEVVPTTTTTVHQANPTEIGIEMIPMKKKPIDTTSAANEDEEDEEDEEDDSFVSDNDDDIEMTTIKRGGDDSNIKEQPQPPSLFVKPHFSPYSPYNLDNHINSFLQKADETNFSFHVTINMYLQKGNTMSPEQKRHLKCERIANNIHRNIAEIKGEKYEMTPDYNISRKEKEKVDKEKAEKEKADKEKEKKGGSRKKKSSFSPRRKTRRRKNKK